MKVPKSLLTLFALLVIATTGVYALIPLFVADVIPPGNCVETDGALDYAHAGNITGSFSGGNSTFYNVTFSDNCASNTSIIEFLCGSSVAPQYSNLAAAVLEDCTSLNYSGCFSGRCM